MLDKANKQNVYLNKAKRGYISLYTEGGPNRGTVKNAMNQALWPLCCFVVDLLLSVWLLWVYLLLLCMFCLDELVAGLVDLRVIIMIIIVIIIIITCLCFLGNENI